MGHMLHLLAESGAKPLASATVEQIRTQQTLAGIARSLAGPTSDNSVKVIDTEIPGTADALAARLYRPRGASSLVPAILFFGDGLFIDTRLNDAEETCRGLVRRSGAAVLSVQVRQAPEHKFPAPHMDALAAWRHLIDEADIMGFDLTRTAIVGEGAGANLAIHCALQARDQGLIQPVHLGLVAPWVLLGADLPDSLENGTSGILSGPDLTSMARKLVRKRVDLKDPRLNPAARADLGGLPPTTIILAGEDRLREEGAALADALRTAGVWVDSTVYEGVVHGFFGLSLTVNKALLAQSHLGRNLAASFGYPLPHRLSAANSR
jgi:acetyl esterase/lipase